MNDESKPARKRRFFQVHLSTAIMLMFAAGGLLWANSTKYFDETDKGHQVGCRGFPFAMWWSDNRLERDFGPLSWMNHDPVFSLPMAALDSFIAAVILFAVWFVCEAWIHRRAAREED
ncbi:MAG TPA: hypothetical protein VKX17_25905 [Planctomycetota bacterium]|nr:hypothetical protein [Planctomycetota bacterium]